MQAKPCGPQDSRLAPARACGIHFAQAWLLLRSLGFPSVYLLFDGLEEWKDTILFPKAPAAGAPAKDRIEGCAVAVAFGRGSCRTDS